MEESKKVKSMAKSDRVMVPAQVAVKVHIIRAFSPFSWTSFLPKIWNKQNGVSQMTPLAYPNSNSNYLLLSTVAMKTPLSLFLETTLSK